MMKKTLAALAIVGLASGMLVGCQQPTKNGDKNDSHMTSDDHGAQEQHDQKKNGDKMDQSKNGKTNGNGQINGQRSNGKTNGQSSNGR